jgi:hypothetical protein
MPSSTDPPVHRNPGFETLKAIDITQFTSLNDQFNRPMLANRIKQRIDPVYLVNG